MNETRARAILAWLALACAMLFIALLFAWQARAQTDPAACLSKLDVASPASLAACGKDLEAVANSLENAAQAVMRRAKNLAEKAAAAGAPAPQPQPQPCTGVACPPSNTPTPTPDPDPTPEPDPAPDPSPGEPDPAPPVEPLPGGIAIDGGAVDPLALGSITTPSGGYPVHDLGAVNGGRAYLISDGAARDVCIARYAIPTTANLTEAVFSIYLDGNNRAITVFPGSFRCLGTEFPSAAPSIERLRKAVADKRIVPFSASAFDGFRPVAMSLDKLDGAAVYRPDRVYYKGSVYDKTFGNISGSAGEATSSRGFVSGDDALLVHAALSGDAALWAKAAERNRVQMLYGLSLPYLAIWSANNHSLRDPQIPYPGDKAYVVEGTLAQFDRYGSLGKWCAPADYPFLAEIEATAGTCYGHDRDQAHQFNHGYAYWLATGDPRAAILQQSVAAYALAASYQGAYSDGRYRPRFGYGRTTANVWTATWKLRDVALNASGPLLWERGRADKMTGDAIDDWTRQWANMAASTELESKASALSHSIDRSANTVYSNFMALAYGPEAAYLWASAGKPAMMTVLAKQTRLRFGLIGGHRGFYGCGTGVGFPIRTADSIPYSDDARYVAWTARCAATQPNDRFDGAPLHYVQRGYWTLRMAADAHRRGWISVDGLDAAVAKMEADRARTTKWNNTATISPKHAGIAF